MHRGSPALQRAREFRHRWFLGRIASCSARVDWSWLRGVAARFRATVLAVAGGGEGKGPSLGCSGGAVCGLCVVAVAEAGGGEGAAVVQRSLW